VGSDAHLTIVDTEKEQKFAKDMVQSNPDGPFLMGIGLQGGPFNLLSREKPL